MFFSDNKSEAHGHIEAMQRLIEQGELYFQQRIAELKLEVIGLDTSISYYKISGDMLGEFEELAGNIKHDVRNGEILEAIDRVKQLKDSLYEGEADDG